MASKIESMTLTRAIIEAGLEPFRNWNGDLAIETQEPFVALTDIIKAADEADLWKMADWCGRAKSQGNGPDVTIYFPGFQFAPQEFDYFDLDDLRAPRLSL